MHECQCAAGHRAEADYKPMSIDFIASEDTFQKALKDLSSKQKAAFLSADAIPALLEQVGRFNAVFVRKSGNKQSLKLEPVYSISANSIADALKGYEYDAMVRLFKYSRNISGAARRDQLTFFFRGIGVPNPSQALAQVAKGYDIDRLYAESRQIQYGLDAMIMLTFRLLPKK